MHIYDVKNRSRIHIVIKIDNIRAFFFLLVLIFDINTLIPGMFCSVWNILSPDLCKIAR